jgi:hypothetical protein
MSRARITAVSQNSRLSSARVMLRKARRPCWSGTIETLLSEPGDTQTRALGVARTEAAPRNVLKG